MSQSILLLFHRPYRQIRKPQPVPHARAPSDCDRIGGQSLCFSEIDPLASAYEIIHGDVERIVHHVVEFAKRPRVHGKDSQESAIRHKDFLFDLGQSPEAGPGPKHAGKEASLCLSDIDRFSSMLNYGRFLGCFFHIRRRPLPLCEKYCDTLTADAFSLLPNDHLEVSFSRSGAVPPR